MIIPKYVSDPAWMQEMIGGFIAYAASCHSYEIDMKTLDTIDEIWHKIYV